MSENVRVIVRSRPMNKNEGNQKVREMVKFFKVLLVPNRILLPSRKSWKFRTCALNWKMARIHQYHPRALLSTVSLMIRRLLKLSTMISAILWWRLVLYWRILLLWCTRNKIWTHPLSQQKGAADRWQYRTMGNHRLIGKVMVKLWIIVNGHFLQYHRRSIDVLPYSVVLPRTIHHSCDVCTPCCVCKVDVTVLVNSVLFNAQYSKSLFVSVAQDNVSLLSPEQH